jgi:surfeit locus 1 family protein
VRARHALRGLVAIGGPVVGLLALAALFAALGSWQWRRAGESRALAAQFAAGAAALPLTAAPLDLDSAALRFRRVELRGEYVPERQFLLDNVVHDGVAGYQVLTPARLDGAWLLVNRGWLPVGDRRVLPDVAVDGEPRALRGRIERLPRPGLRLGASSTDEPLAPLTVLSYPTSVELGARLGRDVYDYQLLLDAAEPDGYVREWRAPGIGAERHLMYAGQWLLLAVGAAAAAIGIAAKAARGRAHAT